MKQLLEGLLFETLVMKYHSVIHSEFHSQFQFHIAPCFKAQSQHQQQGRQTCWSCAESEKQKAFDVESVPIESLTHSYLEASSRASSSFAYCVLVCWVYCMLEAKHRQDIETEAKEGAVGYLATWHESFECGLSALFVFIGRCICQNQPDVHAVNSWSTAYWLGMVWVYWACCLRQSMELSSCCLILSRPCGWATTQRAMDKKIGRFAWNIWLYRWSRSNRKNQSDAPHQKLKRFVAGQQMCNPRSDHLGSEWAVLFGKRFGFEVTHEARRSHWVFVQASWPFFLRITLSLANKPKEYRKCREIKSFLLFVSPYHVISFRPRSVVEVSPRWGQQTEGGHGGCKARSAGCAMHSTLRIASISGNLVSW